MSEKVHFRNFREKFVSTHSFYSLDVIGATVLVCGQLPAVGQVEGGPGGVPGLLGRKPAAGLGHVAEK